MYRAKSAGRAQHALFDEHMRRTAIETLELETDLRRALDREEFFLHYQPIVDLEDESIVGFEALIRWNHPGRGPIMPDVFIPLAEETGLIVPMGSWVLREACRQLAEWHEEEATRPDLSVSVNLSAKQIARESLVEEVSDAIAETGIDPGNLALEITETAIIGNAETAASVLERLRDLGVRIHIDDFGTGYSSLSYLNRYPVETLKIDRSFIGRIGPEDENLDLVRTIIALAHVMGLRVIAEGVENQRQGVLLGSLGCEYGQGFFFARPHPGPFAIELLKGNQGRFDGPLCSSPPGPM
jgi:EAL domain-containing protein (putative c-di-GMP-specific phosphodiesterase class I)